MGSYWSSLIFKQIPRIKQKYTPQPKFLCSLIHGQQDLWHSPVAQWYSSHWSIGKGDLAYTSLVPIDRRDLVKTCWKPSPLPMMVSGKGLEVGGKLELSQSSPGPLWALLCCKVIGSRIRQNWFRSWLLPLRWPWTKYFALVNPAIMENNTRVCFIRDSVRMKLIVPAASSVLSLPYSSWCQFRLVAQESSSVRLFLSSFCIHHNSKSCWLYPWNIQHLPLFVTCTMSCPPLSPHPIQTTSSAYSDHWYNLQTGLSALVPATLSSVLSTEGKVTPLRYS